MGRRLVRDLVVHNNMVSDKVMAWLTAVHKGPLPRFIHYSLSMVKVNNHWLHTVKSQSNYINSFINSIYLYR